MTRIALDASAQPIRNICTNPRMSALPGIYGNAALGLVTGLTGTPHGIPTASRASWPASGATNPGVTFQTGPIATGEAVTMSAWVLVEAGQTTPYSFAVAGQVAGPNVNLVVGQWTRISWTTPAITTTAKEIGFRLGGSISQAGSFLITGVQVERGVATPSPYGDGNSLGWRWINAANGSESVGYAETPNAIANSSFEQGAVSWGFSAGLRTLVTTGGRTGSNCAQMTATGAINDLGITGYTIPTKGGDRWYTEAWFRRVSADADTAAPVSSTTPTVQIAASLFSGGTAYNYPAPVAGMGAIGPQPFQDILIAYPLNTWVKVGGTYIIPDVPASPITHIIPRPSIRAAVTKGVFQVDDVVLRRI